MPSPPRREEYDVLAAHLTRHQLKRSAQREAILDAFLKVEKHVSVEDLLKLVRRRHPEVGRTTIYRTLKVFKQAGLASELVFGEEARFEPIWKRDHHDHFVCTECGAIFEFSSPDIERIQEEIAAGLSFSIEGHRHHIFGKCSKCSEKAVRGRKAKEARGGP
jgi:Fur family transcriptional regulator, ferric uptake regulator